MLDSRKLLQEEKLSIIIDSQSIDRLLTNSSPEVLRLLSNLHRAIFEPLRSPLETKHDLLSCLNNFDSSLDNDDHLTEFSIVRSPNQSETYSISHSSDSVERITRRTFEKDEGAVTAEERNAVSLVLIWAAYKLKHNGILVTENPKLLEKRLSFERRDTAQLLNIVNISEALEIMDIFAKSKGLYLINAHQGLKKGFWYFVSFRSKVPHYHVLSSETLDAFSMRFTHLLQSIDEMGLQYYSGVSCDTMDDILYHFNYFISLTTGIFDNLAIETRNIYNITFAGDNIASRTSLQNNNVGRDFLREVRNINLPLRNHITQHAEFINLVYNLRELVLHREGLKKLSGYSFNDDEARWKANFIVISNDILQMLRRCGDSPERYNILSHWGTTQVTYKNETTLCLEPYKFAKATTLQLVEFCDHYLALLGYANFINSLKPGEYFLSLITDFENLRLGF